MSPLDTCHFCRDCRA